MPLVFEHQRRHDEPFVKITLLGCIDGKLIWASTKIAAIRLDGRIGRLHRHHRRHHRPARSRTGAARERSAAAHHRRHAADHGGLHRRIAGVPLPQPRLRPRVRA
ncbi:hypothetical protein LP420_34675 [Massilia sp. B-10]|nr:hypothetical protein LP420_34675 [Massilia sp. B-10]